MVAADKIGMDLRSPCYKYIRGWRVIAFAIFSILFLSSIFFPETISVRSIQTKQPADLLWEIYKEVTELERFENDNYIKGEFHINLDGNEENKEEHIIVLNHFAGGREKMLLQVTYFESRRKNSPVKYAKCVREIDCCILDRRIEIEKCDYNEVEINALLPGILEGIRDTKKFLNLIK